MIGETVSHYRILEELGAGAMGVVYKAEDVRLKRQIALKFLSAGLTRDPEARERLIQEAQTASALDHPNICVIHEIDEVAGRTFIAMTYYEGETLRKRIARGPLPQNEAIDIAIQIARAAAAAHDAGIVHRDIKPANVIVTPRREIKLLDFGIAKLSGQTRLTRTGTTVGTVAYMAPEVINGGDADARADIWAIGVALFEMLAAALPFEGDNELAILNSIALKEARSARSLRADVSPAVDALLKRVLVKDPARRISSARELEAALAELQHPSGATVPVRTTRTSPRWVGAAVAIVIALAGVSGGWWAINRNSATLSATALPEIEKLLAADEYVPAFGLALRAAPELGEDPALKSLWPRLTVTRDLTAGPPGTRVRVRDIRLETDWIEIGTTPITAARLPRGVVRWRIERAEYEPLEFIGSPVELVAGLNALTRTEDLPAGMVRIPRGTVSLRMSGYDYNKGIPTDAYFIDRFEVTNRQYKEFVDAGAYQHQAYWKQPFVRDGRTIPWRDAVAAFHDQTGRPGPATWEVGTYRGGEEDHPVRGVSWFEAAAYAEFRGRSLPSVYHWLHAAGTPLAAQVTPLSNFRSSGPLPVGRSQAIGPFGLADAAGNIKEWCWNELEPGKTRYLLGGAWNEPDYAFIYPDARSPFDRSAQIGFRLALYPSDASRPAATLRVIPRSVRDYDIEKPVSDEVFHAFAGTYAYDPAPLDARVESVDEGAEFWRREKVTFNSAYGERIAAHLFLPKKTAPPFSPVLYWPGSGTIRERSSDSMATGGFDLLLMSGRAVLVPVYHGAWERTSGRQDSWPDRTSAYRDWVKRQINDARRALDYAATRKDLDMSSVGYLGSSWGARMGSIVLALDGRIRAAVLGAGGLSNAAAPPEVDVFNFSPRVTVPVLMINGDGDFIFELERSQKPLFRLLGSPADRKKHVVLQGGHAIGIEKRSQYIREVLDWFDRYLGVAGR
ncbi:MAG: protein kinase [Vicinamibacterales bacterium]